MSAHLDLVPCMKGGEFLDLVHKVVQPLPVLTLKGVQFGQTGLHWYSHSMWCPGRGCSPVVVFVDWRFSAWLHWLHHNAPIMRHVRVSYIQDQWSLSYLGSPCWFYIDSLLSSQWPGLSHHSCIISPYSFGLHRHLSLYCFWPLLPCRGSPWFSWVTCASCVWVACFDFFTP